MRLRHVACFILLFIFAESVFAASGVFGFEVVIQKPDSSYLQDPNVDFKFTITDDSGACVIYSEDHNGVDMSGTNGQKTFQLGNTLLQTYPNPLVTTLTIDQVFSSSGVVYNCQGGGTYTSTSSASRKVVMEFNDGSGLQTLPAMAINSVPYAVEAQKVVSNSITTQNILDGTITAADLSSMGAATGQVMKWNGSAWVASNDLTGTNLVTSVAGRTGAVVLSSSDISGLGTLAGKNQIQLSTDVTGTLSLANLAQSSATTGQVIKWNGSAWVVSNDDSGTNLVTSVAGRTGAVTLSSADISGIGFGTTSGTFAQGNDARFTDERNPINNSVTSAKIADGTIQSADLSAGSVTLDKLNQSSATTGQVIKWNGSAWVVSDDASGGGGSVTNVTASGPLSSTGGTTPNITIAQANGTTSGYLSSADFSTFAAKLSDFSTLTSADITGKLGYTPLANFTSMTSTDVTTALSYAPLSPSTSFSGDISGVYNNITVNRIKNIPVTLSSITSGDIVQYNGTAFVNRNIPTCAANQYLTFNGTSYSCVTDVGASGTVGSVNTLTGALNLVTGTAGTNFNIDSTGTTITLNMPTASSANRGLLSSSDWSLFNAKLSDFTTLTSADITGKLGYTPVNPATAVISVAGRTGAVTLSSSDISGLGTLAGKNQVNLSTDVIGTLPLANIAQSAATTGQVIKWNGSAWVVSNDITGSGSQWLATGSDIYFNTGNVGIGTTAPNLTGYSSNASVLTVAGSGDAGNGQGILELQNSRTTATVGDSVGNISFLSKNNNGLEKRAAIISSTLSGSGGPNGFGGTMYFSVKSDNTASTSIAMTIKENGYVGIGTPNPSHNLDVVGDVNVTGNFKVNGVNISAGGGTVTSVTASGPLSSTGGATPNITITRATAGADGYLSSADFSSFAAKLSDFSTLTSADITGKLGYTPLANFTSMVSGDVTAALGYVPANVGSVILASQMPANCNAGQTLTFSSPTGAWVCSSIVLANNSVTSSMISSLDWSKVVNTPSNLAGYGVTLLSSDIPSIDATKVTSGVFNTARLGTGTADSSTYLRGDGTWTSPSAAPVLNSNPFYQVRVATTGAITLSGTQTIDGVAVVAGDRVLVKNQSLANVRQNGVYVVSAGAWTRATEMDTWSEVLGYRVQVTSGTTNIGMTYTASVLASGTIDVSNIYFMAAGSQNGYLGSVSLGYGALISESAATNANIAIGSDSLTRNTTGYVNTSIGAGAMAYTTTGYNNTAIGYQALRYNTENTDSTAVGKNAMQNANAAAGNNPTYNTALGVNALQMPTAPLASNTGTQNTAIGHSTLAGLSSGIGNTAVGYNAGSALTTGSYNVIIGNNSGSTFATGSNNISINDGAGNERIRINSAGRVGIGLNNPSYAVDVSGDVNVTGNFKVNGFNISSGSAALSSLTAATAANTIDSNNFDQTWNWSTLNTQTAMSMNANALTTGSILSLATSNASVNSTNGLLYVANNSASTNGTVARIQSNSTAGSGLTVLANGYVGIGTASPSYTLDLPGGQVRSKTAAFENSDANSSGSTFSFWKHRNYANTQAKDELGFMSFWGYETILRRGAYIAANQEAVVAGSVPTRITFATASSGDADASEKMTLTGMGRLGIGVSNPNYAVDVSGDLNITGNFKVNGVNIGSGSGTVSSGTTNKLAYYTGATTVGSNTNMSVSSGALTLGTAGSALGSLSVTGNTSGTVTIQPQAAAGTYNFNLPTTAGTSGQVLTSAGGASAPMTWLTLANSASVDTTNASNITSGTLPAGRLPAFTGDVTTTAGSSATTIADNAVTAAKLESGTNGQLFIGNGTGFTKATLTGTANQVSVANGSGTITLSTPQNIHSAAAPTFAGLTLSGITGNTLLRANASGVLANATSADITSLLGYTPSSSASSWTLNASGDVTRSTGNVGIGTTTPLNALDITGGGGLRLGTGVPTSTASALYNNSGVLYWNGAALGAGANLGVSFSEVSASRAIAGVYQNTNSYPIYVSVTANAISSGTAYAYIGTANNPAVTGTNVAAGTGNTNYNQNVNFIVPPNYYYTVTTNNGTTIVKWTEYALIGNTGDTWSVNGSNAYYNLGNVGIGVSNPGYALQVSGDISVSGNFRINGTALGTVSTGTANKLAYYSSASALSSNTNMSVSSGALTLGTAGSALGSLSVTGNTSGTVTIQPQAAAGTYNFNLPTTAGTSGQVLTSGGGVGAPMTWLTLANSASVDTTNASNITSGTLPAGRLPAHTGDVTSSAGSAALSIANNAVTAAKLESGTNGQLFIGNGTGFTKATLTGTTNQVNVANGSGTITLSTPQNIHSAATPTFAGLTLSGVAGNTLVKTNGSGVLSNATSADVTGLLGYTPQTLNTELTGLAGLSSNGFIRRTAAGTYSSVSSIDLSSQVSGLLPLNNLAQSAAGYGQVIKWDGSSWIASDDNSSGSGGGSGSTVDPGWPDMIYCSGSAGAVILYWTYSDNTGNRVYRANDSNQSTSYLQIVYTSAGAYSTTQVSGAGWTNYYTSCTSQSIAQLYGAGKAYNVVGGGGGVWTQSGANTYFSGGNVGVGILSPSFAVDVSGDINITGNFRVNGSILATGSGTVASGTTNKLAYYTGATTVSSNTNMSVSSGALTLGTAGSALGSLAVTGNTSGTVTIQPQAAAGTYNFNLPTTAGTSGQVLTSGGGASAPMTWLTLANSASVDTTNASNITSGTLPAGRLPAFTGDVTTSAGSSATTIANNAVTSAKILDGTIVSADISSAAITFDKLNQSSATTGQVIKWNGSAWIASNDASGLTGVTSADITTALSYTPVNKSGDTMSGALNLPSNGLVVGSNELVVSGSKVGVGTNSPTGVLQLGTGNTAVKFGNTGSTDARALISAADLKLYTYDTDGVTNGTILLDVGKTSTQFNPGSVQSMLSLNDEGKLGLSTFPLNRLDVWGNAAFGSYAGSATAPSNGLIVSGNVGVGTNSPSYALEVAGGSGYYSGLFRGTNTTTRLGVENSAVAAWGNAAELEFRLDGNDRGKIAVVTTNSAAESYDMTFHTKTSNFPYERMRIRNDGYVGIGTASPYSMLDVAGSVKVGTDSTACSNNLKGALRLNSSVLEFCNGTSWGPLGGLTNFTESVNTSAPNATVPAVQLAATNGAADVDFVIKAKGDGSILAQTPDNTTTGGNKRGVRAVDLQMLRSGSTMVASGSYSVIAGGYNNTASGSGSAVSGGIENLASVGLSLVGAGYRNTAQANYATIVGGQVNNVTSQYGFIGNGYRNDVFGNYASVVNGQNNIASGANSVVLNGNSNVASGDYSSAMGMGSTSPAYAQTTVGQYNMPTGSENLTSWVATDPLFVIGNGTGSGASRSNAVTVLKNGSVGIGTSSPRTSFDVTGAIVSRASQAFSSGTIDFSVSNLRHTTQNCGAFALHNLKDGGTYMFAVQGTTVATCSFTAFSDAGSTALTVHMPPDHAATTSGKHTIYNIAVMGTHAYIAWTPGY